MHPFFQGRHYVEAVKKCRFYFLRVLYAACSSFMQQTHETIFRIHKASCNLKMSEDNPRYVFCHMFRAFSKSATESNSLGQTRSFFERSNSGITMTSRIPFGNWRLTASFNAAIQSDDLPLRLI